MGRRGPRPLSDDQLRARGSDWWRSRRVGAPAADFPQGAPQPPEDLPPEAREEWDCAVEQLLAAGVLSPADRSVLTAYCLSWAHYRKLERQVREEGWSESGARGGAVQSVASRSMAMMLDRSMKLARELGLTPSARPGVQPLAERPSQGLGAAGQSPRAGDPYGLRRGPRGKRPGADGE